MLIPMNEGGQYAYTCISCPALSCLSLDSPGAYTVINYIIVIWKI
jgi:hypothetical protein